MFEYTDTFTNASTFNGVNPKQEKLRDENIRFKIQLLDRKINVSIYKDDSLEDLYISIYNAVYPELSTEKIDVIPPEGLSYMPRIYKVSIYNEKTEHIQEIPLHKFITISSYIQCNKDYFTPIYNFGKPTFAIYALDEYAIANINNNNSQYDIQSYFKKYFTCIM